MKKRIQAAKQELDFDRSSFYLGIIFGLVIGIILATVIPFLFGAIVGVAPNPNDTNEQDKPDINADITVKDLRESDNRMLVQLTNSTNADSIYVISDSDNPDTKASRYYLGSEGNPSSGSTVSVSIDERGGDVYAESGDTVKIIGVKDGQTVVLREFTV